MWLAHKILLHPIPELLSMWDNGKLTSDQAIGHILQTIEAISQWLADTERRVHRSEQPQPEAAPTHSRRSKAGAHTRPA